MKTNWFLFSSKRWRKLGRLLSLCLLCFSLAVGCNREQSSLPTQVTGNNRDRITIGTTLQPRTLDPADSYELAGLMVIYNLSDTLYTYELGTPKLKPQLATAMPKVSEDGLTYTIPLRQGVIFHDGTPFNAEAMAFSLKRFIENGGEPSFLLADTVEKIEATGDRELTIKLKRPFAAFPSLLAFPGACAVSPKAYEIGQEKFNPTKFVGTGPYRLARYRNDSVRLEAFDRYWGEKPKNKGINLQIYAGNEANLYNAFRSRAVDVAYQSLAPQQIRKLQEGAASGNWQAIETLGGAVNFMALNLNLEPIKQRAVREAIAALIDRPFLIERVLQGRGEPVYSLIPKTFDVYKPVFAQTYGNVDLAAVKQLLAEAGYSAQNPVTVELWHSSSSLPFSIVAAILKAIAKRDLDGAIQFEPNSIARTAFFGYVSQGIYQTSFSNWYPDFLDADNYVYPLLHCAKGTEAKGCEEGGSQSQGSAYYSDRVNQLIEQQRQEQNPQKRKAIFAEIQEILARDVPYIPLWQTKDYAFAQNDIVGVTINPSQTFPFWTIKRN
ncbi:peptide ABC transporter substrate-binding protein [Hydrococcus rivularis NIES-593]|uniref:Peptide ABC transporter substrate-binding protein n=1 Tax=Hydrococcus rivularis NIES-593 TaxID=1921803 RepID=A0A1U7HRP5_9CYAN|nr:ABC transporter substrate-binding protein [Hydrococcus rivularis]OKH26218.1 peptide ABC transporter substrate-binding protein [Hydrococcus rivularis NIES-593]